MNEIIKQVREAQGVRTPEIIAAEINYINQKTKETVLANAMEIGRRLCEAKELVKHGEWEQWLEENVSYSQSTANNLMAVFREYGSEQQSLFEKASSRDIEELSYSKAVALLVLPREEREQFLRENPIDSMSTRELQAAIKEAKDAQEELDKAIGERQKYQKLAGDEMAKVSRLTTENDSLNLRVRGMEQELTEAKKASAELKKAQDACKKADGKVKKLQEQIMELEHSRQEADQQTLDQITAEAEERARTQQLQRMEELRAQLEKAQQEKEQIAKRMESAGSEAMLEAKFVLGQLQESFNRMLSLSVELSQKGQEEFAEKLKTAIRNLCGKILERM